MDKNIFDIFKEMNQKDSEEGTRKLAISNNFISADMVNQGTKISMGADQEALHDLMNGEIIPILILVNKEEYFKRKSE